MDLATLSICTSVAEHLRERIAISDRAGGPMTTALPYVKAVDALVLAQIGVRAIRDGIRQRRTSLTSLALTIGAIAEHEHRTGYGRRGDPVMPPSRWGADVHLEVGLALIDCVMRTTDWFVVDLDRTYVSWVAQMREPKLVLAMKDGLAEFVVHRLGSEGLGAATYKPILRANKLPLRTIRTVVGGTRITLAVTETTCDRGRTAPAWRVSYRWRRPKLVNVSASRLQ